MQLPSYNRNMTARTKIPNSILSKRIDQYVYLLVRQDSTNDIFATRLAAWSELRNRLTGPELTQLKSYPQVTRILKKYGHYTLATDSGKWYQLKAYPVVK
jgi:hypothetical protein